jgi:hypothetical protein
MDNLARLQLQALVARHGIGICDEPRRLRALLADLCPGLKREVHVLTTALEQRIASELASSSGGLPWEVLAGRLVRRLAEEAAMTEDAARWAVESWGLALGKAPTAGGRTDKESWTEVLPISRAPQAPGKTNPLPDRQLNQGPPQRHGKLDRSAAGGTWAVDRSFITFFLLFFLLLAGLVGYQYWRNQQSPGLAPQQGVPQEKSVSDHLPLGPGSVRPLPPDQVLKGTSGGISPNPASGTGAVGGPPVISTFTVTVPSAKDRKGADEKTKD